MRFFFFFDNYRNKSKIQMSFKCSRECVQSNEHDLIRLMTNTIDRIIKKTETKTRFVFFLLIETTRRERERAEENNHSHFNLFQLKKTNTETSSRQFILSTYRDD